MKRIFRIGLCVGAGCSAILLGIIVYVQASFFTDIVSPQTNLRADTAIVLGASILQNGTPSDALRDRLLVGIQLYKQGNVNRILLTGDDGSFRADEIDVMKRFTVEQGVPENAILTDGQGYRTYESCKRAKEIFHIRDALVVTQRFHLGRALYLCNSLGIHAQGVTSDLQMYRKIVYFWLRDLVSSAKAWWDINVIPPQSPVTKIAQ